MTGVARFGRAAALSLGDCSSRVCRVARGDDWMAMSAIQDVGNLVRDYPGHPTDYDAAGIWTGTPWDKHGGHDPEGGFYYNQQAIMEKVDGCVEFPQLECAWRGVKSETQRASGFLRRNPDDVVVAVSNDGAMLGPTGGGVPQGTDNPSGHADHWVRLLEPVVYTEGSVTFTVYTWGSASGSTGLRPASTSGYTATWSGRDGEAL